MDYFELFSLNRSYFIDQNLLKKTYLSLQAKYHPDKSRQEKIANHQDQRNNLEKSILINEAFKVLQDDYLRAEYMLKLNGIAVDEFSLKNTLTTDQLQELLDQYELIEETTDPLLLKAIEQEKINEQEALKAAINGSLTKKSFKEALDLTIRLKYLTNLVGNIKLKIKHANY